MIVKIVDDENVMVFGVGVFYQIGLLIYVGLWAYFKYRPYRLLRKEVRLSVYEVEKLNEHSRLVRNWGWLMIYFLPCPFMFLFPEVCVVTQDVNRAKKEWVYPELPDRKTFFVDHYYVPFYYKGNFCAIGREYLSNETDSLLILYPTLFFNGAFAQSVPEKQITVRAHSFQIWNENIDNRFQVPMQYSWKYVPEKHKNQAVTEWTIDTQSGAAIGIDKIEKEIDKRKEVMKEILGR
ncbi:hypothetical protein JCM10556A_24680 [Bacteroides acidifaciens]